MKKIILAVLMFVFLSCDSTPPATPVTDIDGNVYKTVKIGDQVWMAENLKVTKFRDGSEIPNLKDGWMGNRAHTVNNAAPSAYVIYNDNSSNEADTYGYLYNWYAVNDSRNIAPEGWHVPSNADWQTLIDYLGGQKIAGGKMKAGTFKDTTNESGFTGLPGGFREGSYGYGYQNMGTKAYFWSNEEWSDWEADTYILSKTISSDADFLGNGPFDKKFGFSVRCVRDETN